LHYFFRKVIRYFTFALLFLTLAVVACFSYNKKTPKVIFYIFWQM